MKVGLPGRCRTKVVNFGAAEGLTQAELAQLAGLSRETVSRVERGDPPARRTARAIARALDTEPGRLFRPRVRS